MREPIEISISPGLFAKLTAIPNARWSGPRAWTEDEDRALLSFWPIKIKAEVAKALGRAEHVCRRRFIELAEGDT
jgi:hypothetical protein